MDSSGTSAGLTYQKKGNIKVKMALYYSFMTLDTVMLLGFWCWKVLYAGCWSSLNPFMVIPTLLGLYIIGILVKMIYYRWFHPNGDKEKIRKSSEPTEEGQSRLAAACCDIESDWMQSVSLDAGASTQTFARVHNRQRNMAANFYS